MRETIRSMYDRYRGKPWRGDNPSYAKGAPESTQCHTTSICLFTCLIPVQNASIVIIVVRAPSFPFPHFSILRAPFFIPPFLHLRISHRRRTYTLRIANWKRLRKNWVRKGSWGEGVDMGSVRVKGEYLVHRRPLLSPTALSPTKLPQKSLSHDPSPLLKELFLLPRSLGIGPFLPLQIDLRRLRAWFGQKAITCLGSCCLQLR